MRRGFTLIETCVVLAIVAILASLITPVLKGALLASKKTSSANKLRQLQYATKLYQQEHGGDGNYGSLSEMGLPSAIYVYFSRFKLPQASIESSCGAHPYWARPGDNRVPQIFYYPAEGGSTFESAARKWEDRLILFFDVQCNDPSLDISNHYVKKFGLGILFDGSLVRVERDGDYMKPEFWSKPADSH